MILTFPSGWRQAKTTGKTGYPASSNFIRRSLGKGPATARWWSARWALLALLGGLLAGCVPGTGVGRPATVGWSPVSVAGGHVYVATRQGKVQALEDRGFNEAPIKWTFPAESSPDQVPGVHTPPALGERLLYVSSYEGYLYALDRATGQLGDVGWRRPQNQATGRLVGGPALDSEETVVAVGSEDGRLYAYNAITGAPLLWSPFVTGDKVWSTPLIAEGVIYFGSHDYNVYAVSLKDGRELWRFSTGGAVVAQPMLFHNTLVVGSFDRRLYGLNANDGALQWEFQAKNWFWAGAVSDGKVIFAPSMDGNLYALDGSGGLLWSHAMGSPIVATPALLPKGLVVAGKDGKLSLLDPSPADLGPAREVSFTQFNRDTIITAPLASAGDSVYIGSHDSTVRKIQVKDTLVKVWCVTTQAKEGNTQC